MIPKIIHYCWFGNTKKSKLTYKCIRSWKKKCPDYQIVEWNESNYDISNSPLYVRQAYAAKKWAFVTDYIRLQVIYEYGGIYLDTDVELLKNLDPLLKYDSFFGLEGGKFIATGLGFGSVKHASILQELMNDYHNIPFYLPDGSFDTKTCPVRNTEVFLRHGLVLEDVVQVLDNTMLILPSEYLSPVDSFTHKKRITKNTISIHWFAGSWLTKTQRQRARIILKEKKRRIVLDFIDYYMHTPNRLIKRILGEEKYQMIKDRFMK